MFSVTATDKLGHKNYREREPMEVSVNDSLI